MNKEPPAAGGVSTRVVVPFVYLQRCVSTKAASSKSARERTSRLTMNSVTTLMTSQQSANQ
jgi:hypothetical protein